MSDKEIEEMEAYQNLINRITMSDKETKERIERDADNYVSKLHHSKERSLLLSGYIAGARIEHNRSAQQLKEYKDVIRELLPLAQIGLQYESQSFYDKYSPVVDRASKLIDQTDSTK